MPDYPGLRRGGARSGVATGFRGASAVAADIVSAASAVLDGMQRTAGRYGLLGEAAQTHIAQPWQIEMPAGQMAKGSKLPGWKGKGLGAGIGFAIPLLLPEFWRLWYANRDAADQSARWFRAIPGWELWINCAHPPTHSFHAALLCADDDSEGYIMDEVYQSGTPYWAPPRWYSSWMWFMGQYDVLGRRLYLPARSYRSPVQEGPIPIPETWPTYVPIPIEKPVIDHSPAVVASAAVRPGVLNPPAAVPIAWRAIPARNRYHQMSLARGFTWAQQSFMGPFQRSDPRVKPVTPTKPNKPPGKNVRERKPGVKYGRLWKWAKRAAEAGLEACDAVDVLFSTLSKEVRSQAKRGSNGKVSCLEQGRLVYAHFGDINVCEAIQGLINNDLEDRVYGLVGQMAKKAALNNLYTAQRAWNQMERTLEHDRRRVNRREKSKGTFGKPRKRSWGVQDFVPELDMNCKKPDVAPTVTFMRHTVSLENIYKIGE